MAQDPNAPRSRRGVLLAASTGVAALAASRLASPLAVAAVSTPVNVDEDNPSTLLTSITQGTADTDAFAATGDGAGTGVAGTSSTGVGVKGVNDSTIPAVAGLQGDTTGSQFASASTLSPLEVGAYGFSNLDISATGVMGESADGIGVFGLATNNVGLGLLSIGGLGAWIEGGDGAFILSDGDGVGLQAHVGTTASVPNPPLNTALFASVETTATQVGLEAQGRIKFDNRSGRAKILKGHSSIAITVPGVSGSNMAFAVLNTSRTGCWVRAAVCTTGHVTIYTNIAVSADSFVSWMVLG